MSLSLLPADQAELEAHLNGALRQLRAAISEQDLGVMKLHLNASWSAIARALSLAPDAERRARDVARAELENA